MYVRRHTVACGQCIKLLSVNTKVSCFCGLKSAKVASGWGSAPVPLGELCIPPCWDDPGPAYPSRPCGCIPTLAAKSQIRPFICRGGGAAPLLHYVPGRSTTTLRHWYLVVDWLSSFPDYLNLRQQDENKAKDRALYKANPGKKKASVYSDSYKADHEKEASVRDTYKADLEKKMASDNTTH